MALKHAVARRVHKERHQPQARKHLGQLEKKKDYVLRARDFHKKADHLAKLQEKVRLKNPDEFYFRMINTKIDKEKDGRMKDVKTDHLSAEDKELLLSQDARYIGMRRQIALKKVDKMRSNLHNIEEAQKNKERVHIKFNNDDDDIIVSSKKPRASGPGRPSKKVLDEEAIKQIEKNKKSSYRELLETEERFERMSKILNVMETQKQAQSKSVKKKIKNFKGLTQYKFQTKRSK